MWVFGKKWLLNGLLTIVGDLSPLLSGGLLGHLCLSNIAIWFNRVIHWLYRCDEWLIMGDSKLMLLDRNLN